MADILKSIEADFARFIGKMEAAEQLHRDQPIDGIYRRDWQPPASLGRCAVICTAKHLGKLCQRLHFSHTDKQVWRLAR